MMEKGGPQGAHRCYNRPKVQEFTTTSYVAQIGPMAKRRGDGQLLTRFVSCNWHTVDNVWAWRYPKCFPFRP